MLAWLSIWSEVQTCIQSSWCHCHSLSLASIKFRLVLPFWYRLTPVIPDKGPLNRCVCLYICFSSAVHESSYIAVKCSKLLLLVVRVCTLLVGWTKGGGVKRIRTQAHVGWCDRSQRRWPNVIIASMSWSKLRKTTLRHSRWSSTYVAADCVAASPPKSLTIWYNTIQDAVLTCYQKLTWVRLIDRTEPTAKKSGGKNRKIKNGYAQKYR